MRNIRSARQDEGAMSVKRPLQADVMQPKHLETEAIDDIKDEEMKLPQDLELLGSIEDFPK